MCRTSSILTIFHISLRNFLWLSFLGIYLQSITPAQTKSTFYFETDPLIFVLHGFGGHVRVNLKPLKKWEFGIGGGFSAELPETFNDMNKKNKNQGWIVKMNKAYGLFSEYYFKENRKGWFAGSQIMFQEYRIKNSATGPDYSDFTTFVFMTHTGYRWYPVNNGFYARPWIGIGYQTKYKGSAKLGEKRYDIFKILPFAAVHLGYQF